MYLLVEAWENNYKTMNYNYKIMFLELIKIYDMYKYHISILVSFHMAK